MPDENDKAQPKDFLSTLADMPNVVSELSQKMQECVDATAQTGKQSTITLTLKVSLYDTDSDRIQVVDTVSHKPAQFDRKKHLMFRDHEGKLTRTDPNAIDFGSLATVPARPVTFKERS
jgi:hypothetical protein